MNTNNQDRDYQRAREVLNKFIKRRGGVDKAAKSINRQVKLDEDGGWYPYETYFGDDYIAYGDGAATVYLGQWTDDECEGAYSVSCDFIGRWYISLD